MSNWTEDFCIDSAASSFTSSARETVGGGWDLDDFEFDDDDFSSESEPAPPPPSTSLQSSSNKQTAGLATVSEHPHEELVSPKSKGDNDQAGSSGSFVLVSSPSGGDGEGDGKRSFGSGEEDSPQGVTVTGVVEDQESKAQSTRGDSRGVCVDVEAVRVQETRSEKTLKDDDGNGDGNAASGDGCGRFDGWDVGDGSVDELLDDLQDSQGGGVDEMGDIHASQSAESNVKIGTALPIRMNMDYIPQEGTAVRQQGVVGHVSNVQMDERTSVDERNEEGVDDGGEGWGDDDSDVFDQLGEEPLVQEVAKNELTGGAARVLHTRNEGNETDTATVTGLSLCGRQSSDVAFFDSIGVIGEQERTGAIDHSEGLSQQSPVIQSVLQAFVENDQNLVDGMSMGISDVQIERKESDVAFFDEMKVVGDQPVGIPQTVPHSEGHFCPPEEQGATSSQFYSESAMGVSDIQIERKESDVAFFDKMGPESGQGGLCGVNDMDDDNHRDANSLPGQDTLSVERLDMDESNALLEANREGISDGLFDRQGSDVAFFDKMDSHGDTFGGGLPGAAQTVPETVPSTVPETVESNNAGDLYNQQSGVVSDGLFDRRESDVAFFDRMDSHGDTFGGGLPGAAQFVPETVPSTVPETVESNNAGDLYNQQPGVVSDGLFDRQESDVAFFDNIMGGVEESGSGLIREDVDRVEIGQTNVQQIVPPTVPQTTGEKPKVDGQMEIESIELQYGGVGSNVAVFRNDTELESSQTYPEMSQNDQFGAELQGGGVGVADQAAVEETRGQESPFQPYPEQASVPVVPGDHFRKPSDVAFFDNFGGDSADLGPVGTATSIQDLSGRNMLGGLEIQQAVQGEYTNVPDLHKDSTGRVERMENDVVDDLGVDGGLNAPVNENTESTDKQVSDITQAQTLETSKQANDMADFPDYVQELNVRTTVGGGIGAVDNSGQQQVVGDDVAFFENYASQQQVSGSNIQPSLTYTQQEPSGGYSGTAGFGQNGLQGGGDDVAFFDQVWNQNTGAVTGQSTSTQPIQQPTQQPFQQSYSDYGVQQTSQMYGTTEGGAYGSNTSQQYWGLAETHAQQPQADACQTVNAPAVYDPTAYTPVGGETVNYAQSFEPSAYPQPSQQNVGYSQGYDPQSYITQDYNASQTQWGGQGWSGGNATSSAGFSQTYNPVDYYGSQNVGGSNPNPNQNYQAAVGQYGQGQMEMPSYDAFAAYQSGQNMQSGNWGGYDTSQGYNTTGVLGGAQFNGQDDVSFFDQFSGQTGDQPDGATGQMAASGQVDMFSGLEGDDVAFFDKLDDTQQTSQTDLKATNQNTEPTTELPSSQPTPQNEPPAVSVSDIQPPPPPSADVQGGSTVPQEPAGLHDRHADVQGEQYNVGVPPVLQSFGSNLAEQMDGTVIEDPWAQQVPPSVPYVNAAPMVPVQSDVHSLPAHQPTISTTAWPRQQHGRPACPLICFGIGGQVATLFPKVQAGLSNTTTPGAIEMHSLSYLPSILSHRQREAGHAVPSGQLDPVRVAVERFPGPLTQSTPKEKVVSYVSQRRELCAEEEPESGNPDVMKAIWGMLRVLAKNKGQLRSKKGSDIEQELVEVLSPDGTLDGAWVRSVGASPLTQETSNQFHIQSVAAKVQQMLIIGKREEALRVAVDGGLWSIALVLAQSLGPDSFSETAATMATRCLIPGAPIKTLLMLMAGKLDVSQQQDGVVQGPGTVPGSAAPVLYGAPTAGMNLLTPKTDAFLDDWRGNLAILATNKVPKANEALANLGDRLLNERQEVLAAHLCYLAAGITPQFTDAPGPLRLSLLGWDNRDPRSCMSVESIQRTEVLEWAFLAANPNSRLMAFQPYKLLYAYTLAEYGKISEAVQYCELILETIKSLGNQVPPGLMVCGSSAQALQERLQKHAAVFKISLKRSGTFLENFGRILDKGINKLIGVGDGVSGDEGISRPSSQSEGRTPSDAFQSYPRTMSQTSLESMRNPSEDFRQARLSPPPPAPPLTSSIPRPSVSSPRSTTIQQPISPSQSYHAHPTSPPKSPYTPRSASQSLPDRHGGTAQVQKESSVAKEDDVSGGGAVSSGGDGKDGSVKHEPGEHKSGWLSRIWGSKAKDKTEEGKKKKYKVVDLDKPNDYYYNKELGRWVVRGEEDEAKSEAHVGPPPTSFKWNTSKTTTEKSEGGGTQALSSNTTSRSTTALSNRYVDTFGGGASSGRVTPPSSFLPVQPRMASPTPPKFFIPQTTTVDSKVGGEEQEGTPEESKEQTGKSGEFEDIAL